MTWFKVDDSFYDHPKVFDAPDCAVALWIRAGTWSSRNLTNGFVPAGMPARLCDDPERAVRELTNRGLWSRSKGGYQFHDWEEYQPSAEEVRSLRAKRVEAGRLGGLAKAAKQTPSNGLASASSVAKQNAAPTRPGPSRPEEQNLPLAKPARRGRPTDDPDFDRFWTVYPKKADKGHALDMWRRHVVKGGADREAVIRGAERYRDDPRRKPDYTKNAGTWLNGLCWEDQPAERSGSSAGWWNN